MFSRGPLLTLIAILALSINAADVIIDNQGNRIEAEIIRILPDAVEYRPVAESDGALQHCR